MKMKKLTLATLLCSSLFLVACGEDKAGNTQAAGTQASGETAPVSTDKLETKFLTVATGGASGPYNIIGTAMTELFAQKFGVNSKTQTTGASVENLNLLAQQKVEMAMMQSDTLSDAIAGRGAFSTKIDNVQQIAALYPNYVHIIVSAKSGINSIEDLKGKRVSVGSQGGGAEVAVRAFLQGFGITYNDIKPDYLGYAETADALKGGKLDAALLVSGLPNSSLMELQQGFDLKLLPVTPEQVATLQKSAPFFNQMAIPAKTYNNDADLPAVAIMNALAVRSDLTENDVYLITKSLFENLDKLKTAHQAASVITVESAQQNLVAPLHPGAKRYYDEVATTNAPAAEAPVETADTTSEQTSGDQAQAEQK